MLLHHGLRVASARCTAVLLGKMMMLLRRAIVTSLVWLWVWSSQWCHYSHVNDAQDSFDIATYWTQAASDTFEELVRRAACKS